MVSLKVAGDVENEVARRTRDNGPRCSKTDTFAEQQFSLDHDRSRFHAHSIPTNELSSKQAVTSGGIRCECVRPVRPIPSGEWRRVGAVSAERVLDIKCCG